MDKNSFKDEFLAEKRKDMLLNAKGKEALGGIYMGTQQSWEGFYQNTKDYEQYEEFVEYFDNRVEELAGEHSMFEGESINYARNLGIQRRAEWDQLFAEEDINAPSEIFSYIDDSGEKALLEEEEIELISEGEMIDRLEGHHINDVSSNIDNPVLAADPNNIEWATRQGHIELHEGDFQNPTEGEVNEIEKRIDMINEHNRDEILTSSEEVTLLAPVVTTAAIYTGLTVLIKYVFSAYDACI